MIAYVPSINEKTTELCVWALERQDIKVVLIQNQTSLWEKLKSIYLTASTDFFRVDADVIVNRNIHDLRGHKQWWTQGLTYDWYKQDFTHGGVQFVKKEAIPALRKRINEAEGLDRPETYMSRIDEFMNPRQFETMPIICGIQNYRNDAQRVEQTKLNRDNPEVYDFELAKRIEELC